MKKILLIAVLGLSLASCDMDKHKTTTTTVEPDNTARNKEKTVTADDQSETEGDRVITRKIRAVIVDDSGLSTSAKNVKIITINGSVTLDGVVKTAAEKEAVENAVKKIQGVRNVANKIAIDNEQVNR